MKDLDDGTLLGGVETGGTWVNCAIGTSPENLVRETRFRTADPAQTIDRIAGFFERGPRPAAVGIGAFGPVVLDPCSPRWGQVGNTPKPGWQHVPLARPLAERLGVPVRFDTDVNAAALGEFCWGAGRGAASLAYVTVGTGIGAGLLSGDGRPHHGLIHPEVGHMRIPHDRDRDPFPGSCPLHRDCWEGLASGGAIEQRWGRPPEELPREHEGWQLEADYLAAGILSIISVVSPHRMIVGGGVLEHPGLLEAVRRSLQALNAGYLESRQLEDGIEGYLVAPGLSDRAGVLGAIALARRRP